MYSIIMQSVEDGKDQKITFRAIHMDVFIPVDFSRPRMILNPVFMFIFAKIRGYVYPKRILKYEKLPDHSSTLQLHLRNPIDRRYRPYAVE
jgi:hypothetical protein